MHVFQTENVLHQPPTGLVVKTKMNTMLHDVTTYENPINIVNGFEYYFSSFVGGGYFSFQRL